ncbi:MAG TPA: YdeI/OmpD-associated family protein [Burkholderiaceae bacterium]
MPTFFATPKDFRAWLAKHAANETELIVGFYKRDSGHASITWPESVDEVLCFGWIDGVRTRIDELSYKIRFTPRKSTSTWSAINIARVEVLTAEGRMQPAGLAAFEHRREAKSKIYAYEQAARAELDPQDEALFRKNKKAWKFFAAQPPGYRHQMVWRVISAKRAETRAARLAKLIEASENGMRL